MYFNNSSIKEVNAYYDRLGGFQGAKISNYANACSFSKLMQQATAQAVRAAQESQTQHTQAAQASTAHTAHTAPQKETASQTEQSSAENASSKSLADSSNICCDKCHATEQLLLQMMSRNLYTQSALNYPLAGSNTWTAYQNMANLLGRNLF